MTNAPENFEAFVLPDDVEKVEYTPDPKLANVGVFKIEREDHTLGNLLRMQLLRDPDVVFVGYSHPHPYLHHIVLRVQTASNPKSGVPYSPIDATRSALRDLAQEVQHLEGQLQRQLSN